MIYIEADKTDMDKPGPSKVSMAIDESLLTQCLAALLAAGYGIFHIK